MLIRYMLCGLENGNAWACKSFLVGFGCDKLLVSTQKRHLPQISESQQPHRKQAVDFSVPSGEILMIL
jgi:hypothetical protein